MKQQLRKPENWQDFETLCKKLWGEVWECTEIKKNGRSGQVQHGVDVYAVPKGENSYYGIQCKGKDDYTNAQLSTEEIEREIKKAMLFLPPLKKLYFATTANKDSRVEEYIRLKDSEFRQKGLFEIHLFAWEDIVELIDENKKTYNWYVKNIDFATRHQVQLLFQNDTSSLKCEPVFKKVKINYQDRTLLTGVVDRMFNKPEHRFGLLALGSDEKAVFIKTVTEGVPDEPPEDFNDPQPIQHRMQAMPMGSYAVHNKSVCVFGLCVKNIGNDVIEDYKINLTIEGAVQVDTVDKRKYYLDNVRYVYNTHFNSDSEAVIKPSEKYLVQNDTVCFDSICFKPHAEESQVKIFWSLVSRDFNEKGELVIDVVPSFQESTEPMFVEYPDKMPETIKLRNVREYVDTDFYGKPY